MADGKIRGAFNDEQFEAFCQELQALPEKERTLKGIAAFFEKRTGIVASHEAARTFKEGPWSRYLERINAGREAREQLCAAAGAGKHPVDAMEDMVAIELQDHLLAPEGGQINVEWVVKQLATLRASISMRENSRRQQLDLERKQRESEAKLALAEQREKLLLEQVNVLEREREKWERAQKKIAEASEQLRSAKSEDADAIRTKVVDMLDEVMGIKPKK